MLSAIKPIHIVRAPLLFALFLVLSLSEARVAKSLSKSFLRHKGKEHGPPHVPQGVIVGSQIADFSKRMYGELGRVHGNVTHTVREFQGEFEELNTFSSGELANTLSALLEIRLLDLQMSIRHARVMRDAIGVLVGECAQCAPQAGV
jgi:hypothetical protein